MFEIYWHGIISYLDAPNDARISKNFNFMSRFFYSSHSFQPHEISHTGDVIDFDFIVTMIISVVHTKHARQENDLLSFETRESIMCVHVHVKLKVFSTNEIHN